MNKIRLKLNNISRVYLEIILKRLDSQKYLLIFDADFDNNYNSYIALYNKLSKDLTVDFIFNFIDFPLCYLIYNLESIGKQFNSIWSTVSLENRFSKCNICQLNKLCKFNNYGIEERDLLNVTNFNTFRMFKEFFDKLLSIKDVNHNTCNRMVSSLSGFVENRSFINGETDDFVIEMAEDSMNLDALRFILICRNNPDFRERLINVVEDNIESGLISSLILSQIFKDMEMYSPIGIGLEIKNSDKVNIEYYFEFGNISVDLDKIKEMLLRKYNIVTLFNEELLSIGNPAILSIGYNHEKKRFEGIPYIRFSLNAVTIGNLLDMFNVNDDYIRLSLLFLADIFKPVSRVIELKFKYEVPIPVMVYQIPIDWRYDKYRFSEILRYFNIEDTFKRRIELFLSDDSPCLIPVYISISFLNRFTPRVVIYFRSSRWHLIKKFLAND